MYFMQGRQTVPSSSVASGFIWNEQMEPCSPRRLSSAVCYSPLVCTALNHLILKFRNGRGNLWWKIVIWEKGKLRARSPILKKAGCWRKLLWFVCLWASQHTCCCDPDFHHQWPKNHIISTVHKTYSHLLCVACVLTPLLPANMSKSFYLTASLVLLAGWLSCWPSCFSCDCQINALKHFSRSLSDPLPSSLSLPVLVW